MNSTVAVVVMLRVRADGGVVAVLRCESAPVAR